jgi:hypothetical protein
MLVISSMSGHMDLKNFDLNCPAAARMLGNVSGKSKQG